MTTPTPTQFQSGSFSSDGTTGKVSTTFSFSGGTKTGPGFNAFYTVNVPVGNIYEISVSADDYALVSGAGISASSHWDASQKSIVPGSATSACQSFENQEEKIPFTIEYRNAGGPYVLSVIITSTRNSGTSCDCSQASSSNWVQSGEVEIISIKPIEISLNLVNGGIAGDLITHGITTWEVTGKVTCRCGNLEKKVIHKKTRQKKRTANVYVEKIVGGLPPGASTVSQLVTSIFAEGVLWLLNETLLNYFVPVTSQASFQNFLKRMNTPPRIDSGFWTGDLCNENQNT